MRFALTTLLLLATPLAAQTLDQRIDQAMPSLITTYKAFHAAPELSTQEEKTSAIVASRLRELGYTVIDHVGRYGDGKQGFGVAATLKNGSGPTLLIRSDMDGLPVKEETGLPYASTVTTKDPAGNEVSVMHACGHDIHMTTLLGTAAILASMRDRWKGTVILVGQPAEEVVSGASSMLADRLYERVPRPDYAIALHDSATLEAGRIGYTSGYVMAGGDSVNVTIRGMGGHGASPEKTKDPIVVAAQFVLALQTIVSRENSPLDPVVITVGSIHGGTKRNIIPDEVKLLMTVRTYKPEVRARVLASIARIARGVALTAGIPEDRAPIVEVSTTETVESTYNDPKLTSRLVGALQPVLGKDNVIAMDPLMVSEDFGRFGLNRAIPTSMLALGAVDPEKIRAGGPLPSLHSSKFAPVPEPTLRTGVKAMITMAFELLK